MQDYEKPRKMKPADIKMSAELPDEVQASMEMSEPKKKTYAAAKAKVVDMERKKKTGELF
jgi:hypothetical protein